MDDVHFTLSVVTFPLNEGTPRNNNRTILCEPERLEAASLMRNGGAGPIEKCLGEQEARKVEGKGLCVEAHTSFQVRVKRWLLKRGP